MALNLERLESKLDEALAKETPESLLEWLLEKRAKEMEVESKELQKAIEAAYTTVVFDGVVQVVNTITIPSTMTYPISYPIGSIEVKATVPEDYEDISLAA